MEIKSDTNAAEALKLSKKVADVFREYNLECLSCKGMPAETIGKIAFNKGVPLDRFLKDLNSAIE
jgi:NADPH-dependent 7-cyano-7-deazaguanine reductase QueF-like protein